MRKLVTGRQALLWNSSRELTSWSKKVESRERPELSSPHFHRVTHNTGSSSSKGQMSSSGLHGLLCPCARAWGHGWGHTHISRSTRRALGIPVHPDVIKQPQALGHHSFPCHAFIAVMDCTLKICARVNPPSLKQGEPWHSCNLNTWGLKQENGCECGEAWD